MPLPGVKGRFDHFALDPKGQRLFVAALGNNTLEVIDLAAGKPLRSVSGLSKPTGLLYLPEANRILVANGNDGTLRILNGTDQVRAKGPSHTSLGQRPRNQVGQQSPAPTARFIR